MCCHNFRIIHSNGNHIMSTAEFLFVFCAKNKEASIIYHHFYRHIMTCLQKKLEHHSAGSVSVILAINSFMRCPLDSFFIHTFLLYAEIFSIIYIVLPTSIRTLDSIFSSSTYHYAVNI